MNRIIEKQRMPLAVLEKIFNKYDVPDNLYSTNGYAEDRVCIKWQKGKWIVYIGARGEMHCKTEHNNIEDACLKVIERVTDSYSQQKRMQTLFKKEMEVLRSSLHACMIKSAKTRGCLSTRGVAGLRMKRACKVHRKTEKLKEDD